MPEDLGGERNDANESYSLAADELPDECSPVAAHFEVYYKREAVRCNLIARGWLRVLVLIGERPRRSIVCGGASHTLSHLRPMGNSCCGGSEGKAASSSSDSWSNHEARTSARHPGPSRCHIIRPLPDFIHPFSSIRGAGGSTSNPQRDDQARILAAEAVRCTFYLMHVSFPCKPERPRPPCIAMQAAQRQQNFEASAVGKAAYTAVKGAKKPAQSTAQNDNSRDWLS